MRIATCVWFMVALQARDETSPKPSTMTIVAAGLDRIKYLQMSNARHTVAGLIRD